jgi:oligosaccharide repeat unit polymerase
MPLFGLIWAAYAYTATFWILDFESYTSGLVWILASIVILYAGSLAAEPFVDPVSERPSLPLPVNPRALTALRWCCGVAVTLGGLNVIQLFVGRGVSPREIVNFAIVAQLTAQYRADTFTGELVTPYAQRFAFVALFLGTIYGGMLFRATERTGDRLLSIGTLIVVVLLYGVMGSRMGVLYGGTFWFAAFLAAHVATTRPGEPASSRVLVKLGLAGAGVVFGLSTATLFLRYSTNTSGPNWHHMLADPFGYIAAFGLWFDQLSLGHSFEQLYYGARMFFRPFQFLGIAYDPQPVLDVGFTTSNLYTIFRDLIEDFSPIGSMLFFLLFGFGARVMYARTASANSHRRQRSLPWLFFVYAFVLTSVTSGLLMYTSPTVAAVLFILTFRLVPCLVEMPVQE